MKLASLGGLGRTIFNYFAIVVTLFANRLVLPPPRRLKKVQKS